MRADRKSSVVVRSQLSAQYGLCLPAAWTSGQHQAVQAVFRCSCSEVALSSNDDDNEAARGKGLENAHAEPRDGARKRKAERAASERSRDGRRCALSLTDPLIGDCTHTCRKVQPSGSIFGARGCSAIGSRWTLRDNRPGRIERRGWGTSLSVTKRFDPRLERSVDVMVARRPHAA